MNNLTRNLLGMIGRIHCKFAEIYTKSRQEPHKYFFIDQGLTSKYSKQGFTNNQ